MKLQKMTYKTLPPHSLSDLQQWPGETHDEKMCSLLEYLRDEEFVILPFIGTLEDPHAKCYCAFRRLPDGTEEAYNPVLEGDWLEEFPKVIHSVIEYLKGTLVKNNNFRELGPHSLIYEDDVDKIVVYVNGQNLVIIHDGRDVIDNLEMIPLIGDLGDEEVLDQMYLQPILHKF